MGTLELAPLERDHLPQLVAWRALPRVRQHVREYRFLSHTDLEDWYDLQRTNRDWCMMAIVARIREARVHQDDVTTEYHLGVGGFNRIDWLNRSAEVSVLCEPAQYEEEALWHLVRYGFDRLNLHRIQAECYTAERAALCRAAGFTEEGRRRHGFRRDGAWGDSILMSLLESD